MEILTDDNPFNLGSSRTLIISARSNIYQYATFKQLYRPLLYLDNI